MSGEYGYVSILHTTDPAQGEMLAELLRNEGIEARFRGASSTLIGIARNMTSMSVDVPIDDEARAREFLRALEDTAVAVEPGAEPPPAPPPTDTEAHTRRWRFRLALAVAIGLTLATTALIAVLSQRG